MDINWQDLFAPTNSLIEVVLRGTAVYLLIFLLMRIFKREAGEIGLADLLLTVLIADAAQNAMANEYRSLTEGAVLIGTLFFWNRLLDWAAFKSTLMRKLLEPKAVLLVRNGRVLRENLRRELITDEELQSELRLQGLSSVRQVKSCFLESNGKISVTPLAPRDGGHGSGQESAAN